MMAALQMGGQNASAAPPRLQIDPAYGQQQQQLQQPQPQPQQQNNGRGRTANPASAFSPSSDPFNPFALRSPDMASPRGGTPRRNIGMQPSSGMPSNNIAPPYNGQSPSLSQAVLGMGQSHYNTMSPQSVPPHLYQAYMYQMYQQNPASMGSFHA